MIINIEDGIEEYGCPDGLVAIQNAYYEQFLLKKFSPGFKGKNQMKMPAELRIGSVWSGKNIVKVCLALFTLFTEFLLSKKGKNSII